MSQSRIVKDQLHRVLRLNSPPQRIVSLVPSQTELLVDLGLTDHIVGLTKFCFHPKELRTQKTIVGGTKTVRIDKVKALNPDIVLCNKEENTSELVKELEAIAPVHISDIYTLDDSFELIRMYGDLFNVYSAADKLVQEIQTCRHKFHDTIQDTKSCKVAYFIWKTPYMVAAKNTFIDVMLNEAGYENVFANSTRYPEIELDNTALQTADMIFLSSEPFPFKDKHLNYFKNLFPDKKVSIVDGEMFSWYGSRLKFAYDYFQLLAKKKPV
ncbi:ABC transporter substrate-binding protein [Winogradskyella aurantiaca]|uniref:ABC transporter substrate-binding protein n=1 Tax=Winogradskyella aurantiaca TaxID=2219558 RepID=UPI000E1DABF1|nr:helical backbone metal receptor [Winogradskyella aurantiaca]